MATSGQIDRRELWNRYELHNRYIFTGQLVMKTALHIGGGRVKLRESDSPVVLTPDQKPFIPGSSFKGALRSTIEKIVPGLPGFSSCALIDLSDEEQRGLTDKQRESICPTVRQKDIAQQRRRAQDRDETEAIQKRTLKALCDTCLLFGSPFAAARLNIDDLYMPGEEWQDIIQIRDGVAIDRDSEKAKDRLKYDFEVVPASVSFDLKIVLENATPKDLQLVCVGLSEFVHGFGVIGGKRSRGLGVSQLDGLEVSALELTGDEISDEQRRENLRNYLVDRTFSSKVDGAAFLKKHINRVFGVVEE